MTSTGHQHNAPSNHPVFFFSRGSNGYLDPVYLATVRGVNSVPGVLEVLCEAEALVDLDVPLMS